MSLSEPSSVPARVRSARQSHEAAGVVDATRGRVGKRDPEPGSAEALGGAWKDGDVALKPGNVAFPRGELTSKALDAASKALDVTGEGEDAAFWSFDVLPKAFDAASEPKDVVSKGFRVASKPSPVVSKALGAASKAEEIMSSSFRAASSAFGVTSAAFEAASPAVGVGGEGPSPTGWRLISLVRQEPGGSSWSVGLADGRARSLKTGQRLVRDLFQVDVLRDLHGFRS